MAGVITGFAVIAAVIGLGYVLARTGALGEHGQEVLTRLAFSVATPALLFETLARADLATIVSPSMLVTALSAVAAAGLFAVVGLARRWSAGRTTIGALCASYVNSGNLGIPIAVYVLGDASLVAPVLLFQQLLITPVALSVLDLSQPQRRSSIPRLLATPVRNPVVLGSLGGVAVAATDLHLPGAVTDSISLLSGMAVPAVLLAFGMSLRGSALPGRGPDKAAVFFSVALKAFAQPFAAWAIGSAVFDLADGPLFAVVVTSALPAAQNIFTFAARYETSTGLARESILLSTILAVPVLVVVAALLG